MKKSIKKITISPDKSMIAILEYVRNIKGKRDAKSYYNLGAACALNIYDLTTGKLLYMIPKLAFNSELVWSKDRQKIFFISLKNSDEFNDSGLEEYKLSYGRAFVKKGEFTRSIYTYSLDTQKINNIMDGDKLIGLANNNLFFVLGKNIKEVNLSQKRVNLILKSHDYSGDYALSPTGNNIAMLFPHKRLMAYRYFLTVVNKQEVNKRLIIDADYYGQMVWTK